VQSYYAVCQRILVFILTLAFGIFSHSAYASLGGNFSGPVSGTYSCDSGGPLSVPWSGTLAISATSGPPSNTINSWTVTSSDFTFSGSASGGTDFSPPVVFFSSGVSGNVSGSAPGSGSFPANGPALSITVNPDGSISIPTYMIFTAGVTTNCDSVFYFQMSAVTLSPTSSGTDEQVDYEITPGTTGTASQTLNSDVNAIVSDVQHHMNDVMRQWQLALKASMSGSLSADGEVVADTRGQEDSQTPVRIQRTGSGLMMNSMSGMNAGDSNYLYGAWASYSYTDYENDFASTAFDGSRHGGLIGLDVSPWEGVLLGVAVGYEDSDIDTDFNLGKQETDGFTVAPYLGALINDTWSVSASFGYSSLDTDQYRTLPGTTTRVTSSPDSDRWFAMFNLNGLTTYDNWIIGGQIGVLWAKNELDAYVETNSATGATTLVADFDAKLTQFNIGADVAYSYGEFEPFARVMYENDLSQTEVGVIGGPQPSFDDDDVMLGFGLRYFGANNLTGNLEFNTRLDRDDYDEYDISATIRYDW